MTILHFNGFETLGTDATAASAIQARLDVREYVINTSGRLSYLIPDFATVGYALRVDTGVGQSYMHRHELPSALKVTQNASVGTFVIGARIKVGTTGSAYTVFGWLTTDGSPNMRLNISGSGEDLVLSSGAVTISAVVSPGVWHYIEWEFKPTSSGNGGYQKVHVDGVQVHDTGPANVSATFNSAWGFSMNTPQLLDETTTHNWIAYDDFVITHLDGTAHSAPIGPKRIFRSSPNTDDVVQWARSAGADNFALVNSHAFDAATYVHTNTNAHSDDYGMTNIAGIEVEAVQVEVECFNDVSGSPTLHFGLDDGTADEESVVVSDLVNNTFARGVIAAKPSGGAWTTAAYNTTKGTIRFAT